MIEIEHRKKIQNIMQHNQSGSSKNQNIQI